jgi:fumarate hydratase subunit alpha
MREISAGQITQTVEKLCIQACYRLGSDVREQLQKSRSGETSPFGLSILDQLIENIHIAEAEGLPICQDTGMAVIFIEMGQDVHILDGSFLDAIQAGVRSGYQKGYLRKSVLHPLTRINTQDNTPAVIHTEIVSGDTFKITVAPKGFGSENMSRLRMLTPAEGVQGVRDFVLETVLKAGANPCPPVILGIGIGGTMEKAALLSKKALLRIVGDPHPDPDTAFLEQTLLEEVNKTGIGPQGLGGRITALAVHIETYPTHIAGLPVAVNVQCHAARHAEAVL